MDGYRRVERWLLDVQRGLRLADDQPRSGSLDRLLVQVATNLPMLLLVLPAGVLADVVDRRRLLIVAELMATAITAAFAVLVSLGLVTPNLLLLFTFLVSVGGVLTAQHGRPSSRDLSPGGTSPLL
jgi:MFS family permease